MALAALHWAFAQARPAPTSMRRGFVGGWCGDELLNACVHGWRVLDVLFDDGESAFLVAHDDGEPTALGEAFCEVHVAALAASGSVRDECERRAGVASHRSAVSHERRESAVGALFLCGGLGKRNCRGEAEQGCRERCSHNSLKPEVQ